MIGSTCVPVSLSADLSHGAAKLHPVRPEQFLPPASENTFFIPMVPEMSAVCYQVGS